jgi:transcriptional regulator with XRE-family HTH domain
MVRQFGREADQTKRIRQRQGKTIRQLRRMRGLSNRELADQVGVTPGAISQWELGLHSPRQHHQTALARVLDVPWSTIFGLDGEVA